MRKKEILTSLLYFVFVVALDQLTKVIVLDNLYPGETAPVFASWFNLTLAFNKGAAFGIMSGLPEGTRQLALGAAALVALGWMFYLVLTEYKGSNVALIALSLVLGGALGNVLDRALYGHVVDFIDLYWGEWHYPAFNIADSAICIGVVLMLFAPKSKTPTQTLPVS